MSETLSQAVAREVRAPHGTTLHCANWLIEAAWRMIQNNLDPDVAERPEDLVVYGGIGKAARNWECFEQILRSLELLQPDETLLADPVGQARRRLPHSRRRAARAAGELQPGAALGQLGSFSRAG